MIVQTECEHHDIFREILLQLFEHIRSPLSVCNDPTKVSKIEDQQLAYADLVSHLAFLKTIPCPSFNTRYNIEFLGKTLVINEGQYHELPNKNFKAI